MTLEPDVITVVYPPPPPVAAAPGLSLHLPELLMMVAQYCHDPQQMFPHEISPESGGTIHVTVVGTDVTSGKVLLSVLVKVSVSVQVVVRYGYAPPA